jgi:hypothetical protein
MSPSSKRRGASSRPQPQPADEPIEEVDEGEEDEEDYEEYDYEPPGRRYERLGAGAGLAYAVVGFIGSSLLPIGRVDPQDSSAAIARALVADRGRVSAGILLTMLSLFFLLVFLAWLHGWLRDVEGEGGWLTTLAVIGGSVMVAMLLVVVLLSIGATVLDDYGPDPVVARTILVLQWQAVAVTFIPAAAFVGGIGLVGVTTGVLPRWLSVSGVVIAVGLLIPPLAFLPFLLSTLWTGMLAVFLLQRSRFGF